MNLIPSKPTQVKNEEPTRLVIYGQSKVGKTTALSMLPNNLIIDLESGTRYINNAMVIDVCLQAKESKMDELAILRHAYSQLARNPNHGFKFITIDTVDWLEQFIGREVARSNGVDHFSELPYGKGYALLRDRLIDLLDAFHKLGLNVIVVGHRKRTITGEDGKEVTVKDLDLTGKLKNFLFSWSDAIGYLHRQVEEKPEFLSTAISFKTDVLESLEGGCRITGLQNKTVRLITYHTNQNKFVYTNWETIFPESLSNGKTNNKSN